MTMKLQKYAEATMLDIVRVLDAADKLYGAIAEFPDDPSCWTDYITELDTALEYCPGTAANYHYKRRPAGHTELDT